MIKDIIKSQLKEMEKRQKEIKLELTELYLLRSRGQKVDDEKFLVLKEESNFLKKKIGDFKKLVK